MAYTKFCVVWALLNFKSRESANRKQGGPWMPSVWRVPMMLCSTCCPNRSSRLTFLPVLGIPPSLSVCMCEGLLDRNVRDAEDRTSCRVSKCLKSSVQWCNQQNKSVQYSLSTWPRSQSPSSYCMHKRCSGHQCSLQSSRLKDWGELLEVHWPLSVCVKRFIWEWWRNPNVRVHIPPH